MVADMRTPIQLADYLDHVSDEFGNPATIVEAGELAGIKEEELFDFMTNAGFAAMSEVPWPISLAFAKTFFCLGVLAERRKQ